MFFIASKILTFLIIPLNWILLLLFISLLVNDKKRKILVILNLIILFLYSTNILVNPLLKAWEHRFIYFKDIPGKYEAAIVLGGMASPGKVPLDRTHFSGSPDRLLHAAQLYKIGKIRKIIISGGSGQLIGNILPEAQDLKNVLLLHGIPEKDIFIEDKSRNTYENALFSKKLIEDSLNLNSRYILITSAWHMKRSVGCFRKVGLNVLPFSVDSFLQDKKTFYFHFVPNSKHTTRWDTLIHEYIGYLTYKVSGYL